MQGIKTVTFRRVFLLSLIFVCLNVNVWSQDIWNYERCVSEAMVNNASIKQDNFALEKAIVDLKASKFNRVPDLNGNVYTSINNGRALDPITYQYSTQQFLYNNYTLQSNLKLFEGGRQSYTIAKYDLAADIQKLKLDNKKLEVSKNILLQYNEACMLNEIALLWNEKIKLLNQQKQRAQLQSDYGRKTQSAVWEIDVEIERSVQYVEDINFKREVALLKLKTLIGIPLTSPLELNYSNPNLQIDSAAYNAQQLENIVINSSIYKESVSQISFARNDLRIARSYKSPSVNLGGLIGTGYSSRFTNGGLEGKNFKSQFSNNFYQNVSVNIYVPVFNRLQTNFNINRYKINELQNKEVQNQRVQEIREFIHIQNAQIKHSSLRYYQIKNAHDNYSSIVTEADLNFQSGRIEAFELLLKQQQKYALAQSLIELKYNYILSRKTLELFENGAITY